ncbi:MAG: hypothetical protein ACD_20C00258G0001 [uncultured bacterium]|nr:MAG: hypothetical protein ACD_20C00258G0001 [uncultured bacterium]HBH18861.1 tRNA (N(6)-L-threonylcarbamoyladenosine(37)-C(2))-methylthiotransferase MtaB [Cyanobacteria bacterium UBA9579]
MKKVAINTLGCKANQLESSILTDDLVKFGFEVVKFNEKADIYIINTCSVTGKSDNSSRYYIRQAKRRNPESKIVVTGCYAQVAAQEIAEFVEVDLIVGNTEKQSLAELLRTELDSSSDSRIYVSDIMQEKEFRDKKVLSASGRTRANIKVQDGCNFRCSYCIVPYARGNSRSNNLENIIEQVKIITDQGYQELVLSGIHLGQWGLDFKPKKTLVDLIKEIEQVESLKRFRLSSIDPMEFTDELIETLINSKKFCRHLHISLQSGNNEILKLMKRRYTVEYYSELINSLSANIPDLAMGSDIIVGFPGESNQFFEDTYENLEKLPISYIHVFTYSRRKGTPAAEMENQIPQEIKKIRNTKLTELAARKNLEFRKSQLDKELEVLVEFTRDKETGLLKGRSDNYIPILIEGTDDLKNKLVKVKIIEVNENTTKGEILI